MKELLRSRAFLLGLLIKLACLPFFGSFVLLELFIPFLDRVVLHEGLNPWAGINPQQFPYGSVLFILLWAPRALAHLLFGASALGGGMLGIALVKAPLLLFDTVLFVLLCLLSGKRSKQILIYYWFNPVLFYITYIHGQLDVVTTTFCILSLFLLGRKQLTASALAMAAAALCKFHILLIIPLVASFLWNSDFPRPALRRLAHWNGVFLAATLLGFLPLAAAGAFGYASVGSPEFDRIFGMRFSLGGTHVLYFGVFLIMTLMGRMLIGNRLTSRGLFYCAGVSFGALVLITAPMPGWYFWFLPFFAVFFATVVTRAVLIFWLSQAAFFVYFLSFEAFGYPPQPAPQPFSGLALAALQTCIFGLLVIVWLYALREEIPLRGRVPMLIGVAGDSGSGKDTLSGMLLSLLGQRRSVVIEGDDYHRWERHHPNWAHHSHLSPKANNLGDLLMNTDALVKGFPIYYRHYDHGGGVFTEPREIEPRLNIVVQGLHTFLYRGMRRQFDLKIFLHPDETVRVAWKLRRDVRERQADVGKVLQTIAKRAPDAKLHIHPQAAYADWTIQFFPLQPVDQEAVLAGGDLDLGLRCVLWNDAPVQGLLSELAQITTVTSEVHLGDDPERMSLVFIGTITAQEVGAIGARTFPDLRTVTRAWEPPTWEGGYRGLMQLLALVLIKHSQSRLA